MARRRAWRGAMSTSRRPRYPCLEACDLLQLLGHREHLLARVARRRLGFVARCEREEQLPPQLVIMTFVRLDRVLVEARCRLVARCPAVADELGVAHHG